MKIQPINDRVMVEEVYQDSVTESGIIIPDQAKEKPTTGKVCFVGSGGTVNGAFRPTQLKVGDTVMFGKFAGNEIKFEGRTFRMLLESDIFAVLTD